MHTLHKQRDIADISDNLSFSRPASKGSANRAKLKKRRYWGSRDVVGGGSARVSFKCGGEVGQL